MDIVTGRVGDVVEVELPYSEVCMYMRVAGKRMKVRILEHGAVPLNADGSQFCPAITHGEAGVRVQN